MMLIDALLTTELGTYLAPCKSSQGSDTMNILIVSSSANGDASVSNSLVSRFVERLHPAARIVRRDVGTSPLPHLTSETVAAIKGEPQTPAELEARALSDELIAEMRAADLILIASPMYNFGMSSTLKAWFDHVLRAGVTFRYTENGPEGLMGDKKVVVIQSRAGAYGADGTPGMDGQEPHIRILLGFMGITDVTWIRAEKLAFGPEAAQASIDAAARELNDIAVAALPLAA